MLQDIFIPELLGTAVLVLMGCGVVANVALARSKGFGGGWLLVNFGWGLAVFAGVFVAYRSGAHLNPAVTLGLWAGGNEEFGPGIAANASNAVVYVAAQMVGAIIGALLCWLSYKKHFDATEDQAATLGVFATGPAMRTPAWNVVTEAVGTFVLVFGVMNFGNWPGDLGPLPVALLIVGIGASLGGPTGYALNPARDLGPRIAHAFLPIQGKGGSDWAYSWVPVVGPVVGGVLAGLLMAALGGPGALA